MQIKDPVCGMDVDLSQTPYKAVYEGKTYGFCTQLCQVLFSEDPKEYLEGADERSQPNEKK